MNVVFDLGFLLLIGVILVVILYLIVMGVGLIVVIFYVLKFSVNLCDMVVIVFNFVLFFFGFYVLNSYNVVVIEVEEVGLFFFEEFYVWIIVLFCLIILYFCWCIWGIFLVIVGLVMFIYFFYG